MNPIARKFKERADAIDSLLCVGLDPELEKMPALFWEKEYPLYSFGKWIINETVDYAAAYKPNMAFYESYGGAGLTQLKMTMNYLRDKCPEIVTICDGKRGDNHVTNRGYVAEIFDWLGADAVTLHPYMGREALAPFLDRKDKACIVLCRTSNEGAAEFQDLDVGGKPLWLKVAETATGEWDTNGNVMLVVGATYPEEMARVRAVAPRTTFLVPGVGAQGGDVEAIVRAGLDAEGRGMMIASSRGILYSESPAAAALALRDEINAARKAVHAAR